MRCATAFLSMLVLLAGPVAGGSRVAIINIQKALLSSKEGVSAVEQLRKKFDGADRTEQSRNEVERERTQILKALTKKMQSVIDEYAKRKKYTVVLDISNPSGPVIFFKSADDITDRIVKMYDAAHPVPGKP